MDALPTLLLVTPALEGHKAGKKPKVPSDIAAVAHVIQVEGEQSSIPDVNGVIIWNHVSHVVHAHYKTFAKEKGVPYVSKASWSRLREIAPEKMPWLAQALNGKIQAPPTKSARYHVVAVLQKHKGLTSAEIREFCPDVNQGAVTGALRDLFKAGLLARHDIGGSPFCYFIRDPLAGQHYLNGMSLKEVTKRIESPVSPALTALPPKPGTPEPLAAVLDAITQLRKTSELLLVDVQKVEDRVLELSQVLEKPDVLEEVEQIGGLLSDLIRKHRDTKGTF